MYDAPVFAVYSAAGGLRLPDPVRTRLVDDPASCDTSYTAEILKPGPGFMKGLYLC